MDQTWQYFFLNFCILQTIFIIWVKKNEYEDLILWAIEITQRRKQVILIWHFSFPLLVRYIFNINRETDKELLKYSEIILHTVMMLSITTQFKMHPLNKSTEGLRTKLPKWRINICQKRNYGSENVSSSKDKKLRRRWLWRKFRKWNLVYN